jgi:expansin (peptidoglycan-binding protein)
LEGVLGDFGLAMALRVAGGRDGVLRVQGPAGHGCVYVRARRIIGATYAGQDGLDALAAIEMLKNARFGYFPLALSIPPTLDLDIEGLPNALREFRAARE